MKLSILIAFLILLAASCGEPDGRTCEGGRHAFDGDRSIGCYKMTCAWGLEYEGWLHDDPFNEVKGSSTRVKAMLVAMHRGETPCK